MRIVEKLLYGIGGLLALILLFIAFCHYNPNVAQEIGETIQSGGNAPVKTVAKPKPKPTFQGNTGVPTEEAALEELSIGPVPRDPIVVSATVTTQALPEAAAASAAKTSEPEEDLDIPEKVAGLAGYVPVRATGTEVTQKRAAEILDSLSPGKTGEGLTFDSEKYPYYEMLGDTQKAIYRQIYANADAMTKQFSPVENITSGDLKNAFTAVVNDHPELFWVETAYKYRHSPAGQVAEITLAYDEENKSLYIEGNCWSGMNVGMIEKGMVSEMAQDGEALLYDDGYGNQIFIYLLDTGELDVRQKGEFGGVGTTFEGIYERISW